MGAICICYWHMASVEHKGLQWTFSPVLGGDFGVGGWVLMEVWNHAERRSVWDRHGFRDELKFKRIPAPVEKALARKVKGVKKIEPWPGED